jgi:hypothetical protein
VPARAGARRPSPGRSQRRWRSRVARRPSPVARCPAEIGTLATELIGKLVNTARRANGAGESLANRMQRATCESLRIPVLGAIHGTGEH